MFNIDQHGIITSHELNKTSCAWLVSGQHVLEANVMVVVLVSLASRLLLIIFVVVLIMDVITYTHQFDRDLALQCVTFTA